MSDLFRLVYGSRIAPQAAADLEPVLVDITCASVRNNRAADITGLLVAHDGWFLQALEGPKAAVERRYAVITADPRHHGLLVLGRDAAPRRLFERWSMCARQVSASDAAILSVLRESPAFRPSPDSGADVLRLLTMVAAVHKRALDKGYAAADAAVAA